MADESSDRLDRFFDAMWPFLERRADLASVERALGKSPSGGPRLALYPELLRRQKRGALDHFYRGVRAAAELAHPTLWATIAETYIREIPATHWEPNHHGHEMSAFLERRRATDKRVSRALPELADFTWIRYMVMIAEHPAGPEPDLGRSIFVRQYTHEAPRFVLGAEAGTLAAGTLPVPGVCTVIVCRSRLTGRLAVVRPSFPMLLALKAREAPDAATEPPPGVTAADLSAADDELVATGALAARPIRLEDAASP